MSSEIWVKNLVPPLSLFPFHPAAFPFSPHSPQATIQLQVALLVFMSLQELVKLARFSLWCFLWIPQNLFLFIFGFLCKMRLIHASWLELHPQAALAIRVMPIQMRNDLAKDKVCPDFCQG